MAYDEARGKRNVSRFVEVSLLTLVIGSLVGWENSFKTLELVLPYSVALIVALRGLDAHYNPKRV